MYKYQFPTLEEVTDEVIVYRDYLQTYDPEDIMDEEGNVYGDIRLQVTESGWQVNTGDPCFDTDHNGAWGAGTVSPDDDDETCGIIAAALLEEAKDDAAQLDD